MSKTEGASALHERKKTWVFVSTEYSGATSNYSGMLGGSRLIPRVPDILDMQPMWDFLMADYVCEFWDLSLPHKIRRVMILAWVIANEL